MKLLVVTQAVDVEDTTLGFFIRWIEAFAKHNERVGVICLKEGQHALPENVRVYSLGKEKGASRLVCLLHFYTYVWRLRHEYDAVFVHMNQEYVLLAGLFWKLLGKKVYLWRNHAKGSWQTRYAVLLSDRVFYTSPNSYTATFRNARRMPVGIDTEYFTPAATQAQQDTILFFGRLDPVKNADVFVEALVAVPAPFRADVYGNPTLPDSAYAQSVVAKAQPLVAAGVLGVHPGVSYAQACALFQSHAVYVNLTPSGSFDKMIGEAMMCGCIVVSSNAALRGIIHPMFTVRDNDPIDVARGIGAALSLSAQERTAEVQKLRTYIVENHSLERLAEDIQREIKGT